MRVGLVVVVCAVALAGCQTSARGKGEQFMSDTEIEAKDDGTCRQLGTAPGTPLYVDCRLRLRSNRTAEDSAEQMSGAVLWGMMKR